MIMCQNVSKQICNFAQCLPSETRLMSDARVG